METVRIFKQTCSRGSRGRQPIQLRLPQVAVLVVEYVVKLAGGPIITTKSYGVDDSSLSWRQELAARDHMLDHGQLGPPTPASAGFMSPAESRRPSMNETKPRRPSFKDQLDPLSRRPSTGEHVTVNISRRSSQPGSFTGSRPRRSSLLASEGAAVLGRGLSDSLSMSALEIEDEAMEDEEDVVDVKEVSKETPLPTSFSNNGFAHSSDLTAELYANPKLAGLRSPMGLSMTPMQSSAKPTTPTLPPLLVNPKCSGYFLEPVSIQLQTWIIIH